MQVPALKLAVAPCLFLGVCAAALLASPVPKPTDRKPADKDAPETETARPAVDYAKIADNPLLAAGEARLRRSSLNNLKQLALAVHNYEATYGHLPADIVHNGKAILSWRVQLLPYIEELPLHMQFKLTEPWDGPNNRKLIDKMPKLFASPRVMLKKKGYTVYQGFSGPDALFRPGQKPYTIAGIPDGTSNTLLAVEASVAVPWSKPADISFDQKKKLADIGKAYGQRPVGVLLDGSGRVLDLKQIKPETLKAAITPSGGEVMGQDWNP